MDGSVPRKLGPGRATTLGCMFSDTSERPRYQRCWSKWHVAAGVEPVGMRKIPAVPDVVLTPREQAEWHEIEEELKQAEAEWDRIEQARNPE